MDLCAAVVDFVGEKWRDSQKFCVGSGAAAENFVREVFDEAVLLPEIIKPSIIK
jgi:hypothetical protein